MSQLADLAESIFITEFDSDTSITNVTAINAWLEENLGLLNTLINTSYQGTDPGLGLEESAIYKLIYLYNYYSKQARNTLRGIISSTGGGNILSVADGDNRIQFVNKNEVGKTFKDLAKDVKLQLDQVVAKYNIYGAKPLQVGGIEAAKEESQASPTRQENLNTLIQDLENLISQGGTDNVVFDGGEDNAPAEPPTELTDIITTLQTFNPDTNPSTFILDGSSID